jgi:cytochrome c556
MKRNSLFTVTHRTFFFILFLFSLPLLSLSAKENVTLKKPPTSLQQWYKPGNKRNVFQHNMFKLRRELQAINQYRAEEDLVHTQKWVSDFVEHYRKIADMVPEWKSEIDLKRAKQLELGAKQGDFKAIGRAVKKLQKSCRDCHESYRSQVAAIYRVPDFSQINVQLNGEKTDYNHFMKLLMRDVNRIKIYADDDNQIKANVAFNDLQNKMTSLRSSCANCHESDKAKEYYLGKETTVLMDKLKASIETGNSGRPLGEFAVKACALCHGTHRIVYDLKERIK